MATTLVFCFYSYDPSSGDRLHSRRAAILDTIERLNGVPLRETGMEVDASELDADGFLDGPAGCDDPSHRQRM